MSVLGDDPRPGSSPPLNTQRWSATPATQTDWVTWGDVCYVFHHPSGQTHFLNQVAGEILLLLQTSALTTGAVYRAILEQHEIDDDPAFSDAVVQVLGVLDNLGLVNCTP